MFRHIAFVLTAILLRANAPFSGALGHNVPVIRAAKGVTTHLAANRASRRVRVLRAQPVDTMPGTATLAAVTSPPVAPMLSPDAAAPAAASPADPPGSPLGPAPAFSESAADLGLRSPSFLAAVARCSRRAASSATAARRARRRSVN